MKFKIVEANRTNQNGLSHSAPILCGIIVETSAATIGKSVCREVSRNLEGICVGKITAKQVRVTGFDPVAKYQYDFVLVAI